MKSWPSSLRWQMAATTALSTVAATVVVLSGLTLYYLSLERTILENVSPATRAAIQSQNNMQWVISETQGKEIERVIETSFLFHIESAVWIVLLLAGIAVGALIGAYWGGRVARPIEGVVRAANGIAHGDLSARAPITRRLRGETAALVENFNALAEGLAEAERELAGSASAIAHELRTPVTILRARLQAVLDGVFSLNERELAGLIAQADLMSAIIDDMQILSLAGARQLDLHCARIDLGREAETVIASLAPGWDSAGLQIESDLRTTPANADPVRVRQILNALLDNARRYASDGGCVRVETRLERGAPRLFVLDRGPGLPLEMGDAIFDRFSRGEPSRSRETGGTGLGLAVVKAIAEAHGGSVRAANRSGGGAVFEVSFPAI